MAPQQQYTQLTNDDGYHQSEEDVFAQFKAKPYTLDLNAFSSPYGTLPEDHVYYYSDILDILNHERDPNRRRNRYRVILHGSKSKQVRPLFQHPEVPTTWTSTLKSIQRKYYNSKIGSGLDSDFQMMIELGLINHLLILMTHGYRHVKQDRKGPVNVDYFLYEKDFLRGDHTHYPVYAAQILYMMFLISDDNTFRAIIERYFTEEQNGQYSSQLINDGRLVVMNGVGVLHKVLKYGVVGQKELICEMIRTIHERFVTLKIDLPDFLLFNQAFPLPDALLQFVKDYANPETMWTEFENEGYYQCDIFPRMDPEYEKGKHHSRKWLDSACTKAIMDMTLLATRAKRKGKRLQFIKPSMILQILDIIDTWPHVDNYSTLFSPIRRFLLNLIATLLFDEEKYDEEGNLERIINIDYELLDQLSIDFPVERICKMLTRIYLDPCYQSSKLEEMFINLQKVDHGLGTSLHDALNNILCEQLSLLDLLAWLSTNPILATKIAHYENNSLLNILIHNLDVTNNDNTNTRAYNTPSPATSYIYDDTHEYSYVTLPKHCSSKNILGNILMAVPELNCKINADSMFYPKYLSEILEFKRLVNTIEVSQKKNYASALARYRQMFRMLNDTLEENIPLQTVEEKVIISSNIGEMAIRLNKKALAESYVKYSLKLDPNYEKSKKRLETIRKLK